MRPWDIRLTVVGFVILFLVLLGAWILTRG